MTIGNFLQLSFSSGMPPNDIQGDSRYIVHRVEEFLRRRRIEIA